MGVFYFNDTLVDPPLSNPTGVGPSAGTPLWNTAQFTPIEANDPVVGRIYRVCAGGTLTIGRTTSSLQIIPLIGTTVAGGTSIGSVTKLSGVIFTSQPWWLEFIVVFRSVGAPGVNSTLVGEGLFGCVNASTANSNMLFALGGTQVSCDASINQGICIAASISANGGTMTTHFALIQSLT